MGNRWDNMVLTKLKGGILWKAESFVSDLLKNRLPEKITFHTLRHTRNVVQAVAEISIFLNLAAEDLENIALAAWFHDTGFTVDYRGHVSAGQNIAIRFLTDHKFDKSRTTLITSCIAATAMPQRPGTLLERILCDADLYHLAAGDYADQLELLRREWAFFRHLEVDDEEWILLNLEFLAKHRYFTAYGKAVLEPRKEANIQVLLDQL